MTNEELEQAVREVNEGLKGLPESDKPLSKEDIKRKRLLLLKKDTLEKIKDAKEKNQKDEELYHAMFYGLLTSWGEKHPYLASLAKASFRWNMF